MNGMRRATPGLGIGAVVITLGTMGLAILASPSFAWTRDALSNLGDAADPAGTGLTVLLFNGGLIVGGALGAGFAVGLVLAEAHFVRRLGAGAFACSMLAMAGVGLFPQGHPLHFGVAVSFYLLFSVAAGLYGIGQVLDGTIRAGVVSVALGVANLLVWLGWGATGAITRPGLAIPEIVGALLIAAWTLLQSRRLRTVR